MLDRQLVCKEAHPEQPHILAWPSSAASGAKGCPKSFSSRLLTKVTPAVSCRSFRELADVVRACVLCLFKIQCRLNVPLDMRFLLHMAAAAPTRLRPPDDVQVKGIVLIFRPLPYHRACFSDLRCTCPPPWRGFISSCVFLFRESTM